MLMGADDGAIDEVQLPIELAGGIGLPCERVKQALEDAGSLPAVEATGDGAPGAIALGQIPPGRPGAQDPQETVQDAPMIDRWPTSARFLGREQRLQPLPLGIGQIASVHAL
jgi:hypothetical protein